jgi:nicotinate phosphoribosyltransferase
MGTSADRPYLDVIYKLCETITANGDSLPIMKLSKDKITLPGRKQVYRFKNRIGDFEKDVIALADEKMQGDPLLIKVMEKGKITYNLPSLKEIRASVVHNFSLLPDGYKALTDAPVYQVELSQNLLKLIKALTRQITEKEINGASNLSA